MDNNITALQNLYIALGGELTDTYDDIANGAPVSDYVIKPDVINAIAQLAAAIAGNQLPEVDTDDNGKVLKVANGKWGVGTDATA